MLEVLKMCNLNCLYLIFKSKGGLELHTKSVKLRVKLKLKVWENQVQPLKLSSIFKSNEKMDGRIRVLVIQIIQSSVIDLKETLLEVAETRSLLLGSIGARSGFLLHLLLLFLHTSMAVVSE